MAGLDLVKDEAGMDRLDNIEDADLLAELEAMKAWVGNWYVFWIISKLQFTLQFLFIISIDI